MLLFLKAISIYNSGWKKINNHNQWHNTIYHLVLAWDSSFVLWLYSLISLITSFFNWITDLWAKCHDIREDGQLCFQICFTKKNISLPFMFVTCTIQYLILEFDLCRRKCDTQVLSTNVFIRITFHSDKLRGQMLA